MTLSNLDKLGDFLPHLPSSSGGGGSMAIGGAITNASDGSILFVGAGGVLAQDAALFWDDTDNQLVLGAGTVGKPSLIFGDDTTGLWRPAPDVIGVARAGVDVLRIGGTGPDSDQTLTFGRLQIDSRSTDRAMLSHRDMTLTTQYALSQTATGQGSLNSATGQNCGIAQGGSTKWYVDGTSSNWFPGGDAIGGCDIGGTTARVRNMFIGGYFEGSEIADPAAPAADKGRLYFKDNGAAKTQLVVRFPTGAVQVIATEP